MEKQLFQSEKMYQISMLIARNMRDQGLLTEKELEEIDTIFLEKYRPISSTLLSGRPLLLS